MRVQFTFTHVATRKVVAEFTIDPKLQLYHVMDTIEQLIDGKPYPLNDIVMKMREIPDSN